MGKKKAPQLNGTARTGYLKSHVSEEKTQAVYRKPKQIMRSDVVKDKDISVFRKVRVTQN